MENALPLFEADPKIVDFAMYRAAHPREPQPVPPVFDRQARPVTARAAAHRWLMLRHLASQTRVAAGRRD